MKNIVLLFLLLKCSNAVSQKQTILAQYISTEQNYNSFFLGSDTFDYSYAVEKNVFSKYKSNETLTYKNIQFGKLTKVDLINPLRIALFYEGFNTVVLLDNQLNETSVINFSTNETPISAIAVGMASQNQLWVYNSLNQQIGLYNYLKNDYKNVSIPLKTDSIYYQTDFNNFFWIDTELNWYSCDLFGKITLLAKVDPFQNIQILNDHQFISQKDNQLFYNTIDKNKFVSRTQIQVSEKSLENFYYKDQILSIFTTSEKTNYKIILP